MPPTAPTLPGTGDRRVARVDVLLRRLRGGSASNSAALVAVPRVAASTTTTPTLGTPRTRGVAGAVRPGDRGEGVLRGASGSHSLGRTPPYKGRSRARPVRSVSGTERPSVTNGRLERAAGGHRRTLVGHRPAIAIERCPVAPPSWVTFVHLSEPPMGERMTERVACGRPARRGEGQRLLERLDLSHGPNLPSHVAYRPALDGLTHTRFWCRRGDAGPCRARECGLEVDPRPAARSSR